MYACHAICDGVVRCGVVWCGSSFLSSFLYERASHPFHIDSESTHNDFARNIFRGAIRSSPQSLEKDPHHPSLPLPLPPTIAPSIPPIASATHHPTIHPSHCLCHPPSHHPSLPLPLPPTIPPSIPPIASATHHPTIHPSHCLCHPPSHHPSLPLPLPPTIPPPIPPIASASHHPTTHPSHCLCLPPSHHPSLLLPLPPTIPPPIPPTILVTLPATSSKAPSLLCLSPHLSPPPISPPPLSPPPISPPPLSPPPLSPPPISPPPLSPPPLSPPPISPPPLSPPSLPPPHLPSDFARNIFRGAIPSFFATLTNLSMLELNESGTVCPGASQPCVVHQTSTSQFCINCPDFCSSCSNSPAPSPGSPSASPSPPPPANNTPPPPSTDASSSSSSGLPLGAIIGIAVGGVLVIVLLVIGLFLLWKRRSKPEGREEEPEGAQVTAGASEGSGLSVVLSQVLMCQRYSFATVAKATNDWAEANHIGSGGYGEVEEMASKSHPHLVRLLGYCVDMDMTTEHHEKIVIYEFCANGDLEKYLSGGEKGAQVQ
ncbi:unnamed protein product [Closterium sp. NIES-64]|nr:unnamed protein product [Closterium sp. NIES-64]